MFDVTLKPRENAIMSSVALVSIQSNKIEAMMQAIEKSLDLADYSFRKEIRNVVIKPNMCYYWDYSTGQTTDPLFVAALIESLRQRISFDIDISVVEADASAMKCKYAFRILGYEKMAEDHGVKLINLSEDKTTRTTVTAGNQTFHLAIPQTIQNADLRINVPKIKYTVPGTELTCALKNIFGCNPYPKKFRLHQKLGEAIVALNKAMEFDTHIIDANIVAGMQTRKLGLVMASTDPVAIDAAAAKIAGLNPNRIAYLKLAQKEGLGKLDFTPKGEPLNYFRDLYPKKTIKNKLISKAYTLAIKTGLGKRLGLE